MPSSTDGDDMPFYHPQWNEHDKPTVRCPHVEGRRIGDDYCQHVCPHLTRVIDRQYETIIDCGYTVRRNHTPDAGGCRLQTTIATPAESAPAPSEDWEKKYKELLVMTDLPVIANMHDRMVDAEAEVKALREALEQVALPGVGLANIFEDHPEETIDKYYAAYKYCMRDIERRMTIARAALDGSAKEEI